MNKSLIRTGLSVVSAFVALQFICLPAVAQVSKEVLDSISTPHQVETSIGTLEPWIEKTWRPSEIELVNGSWTFPNTKPAE
jgi:ABC-type phosphate transport system permease subunit